VRYVFLFVLALAGCTREPAVESLYQNARQSLRAERYQAASDATEAALKRVQQGSDLCWKLRLLRVEILLARHQPDQADRALQFALPTGPQWTEYQARYCLYQSTILYLRHQYLDARLKLNEARRLAGPTAAPGLLAEIELRAGSVAAEDGHFEEAEANLRRMSDYAAKAADAYLQMEAIGSMGALLMDSYRYEEAVRWFTRTLDNAHSLGALDSEARAMGNLGWCYYRLGDDDKALRYLQQAAAACDKTGDALDGETWRGDLAGVLRSGHDYTGAVANYQRALQAARDLKDDGEIATWLDDLAMIFIEKRDWSAAERDNQEAWELWRKLKDKSGEAWAIANAGAIAAGRKDFKLAEALFRSVITVSDDPELRLNTSSSLALMFVEAGSDRDAEAQFRSTNALLENQRTKLEEDQDRLTYFSSVIEFYQDYVDFLMSKGRIREALDVAESSRARLLADKLHRSRPHGGRTAADFQRLAAGTGSVLLSYWLGPRNSYVWVVTPASITSLPLPPEPQIRTLAKNYDSLIQSTRDPLVSDNTAGRQLYDTLIKPALPLLSDARRIVLVPDGPLYSLNLETLPVFSDRPHYWIEDADVSIAPSLGLLSAGPARSGENALLLMGNPKSPTEEYPALEYAAQEMTSIEQSLPTYRKVVLPGLEAQPDAYARSDLASFSLIHFVAHATANREEPLESAVILSRHGDNYELRAKDVIDKPLHADLVTISACHSAGARTYAGEGLVGFSWAFLEAGARNVIAGLWDVNDRSTTELMAALYSGLSRGQRPAEALRSAKLQLIRSTGPYHKPYYWGPFEIFTSSPR
jgi:CHAT domain-containing protein